MIRLRVLGATELRAADGRELRSVLAQPKRLALLVYLAATPGFHRRDTLLALFWPELDASRARDALNQAVRFLRKELGGSPTSVLIGRGAAELGIEPGALWCDLAAFREHMAARRFGEALDLYRDDLLPGFFSEQAAGFEEWLEGERARVRAEAARAAREVAESRERERNHTAAVLAARRAVELTGLDERAVRNLLALLDRLGDRAGALHAFDEFAARLSADLGAEPAPETHAVVERIRQRPVASPERVDDTPTASPSGLRIVRELGHGGTAIVYMAFDAKHDRHVALKLLRPELTAWLGTERFLREIQITAQLAHPHILPLIDSGVRDGLPYLVTPFVAGETLRARLDREQRLPLADALRLTTEVAEALDYAHRCGIVHRDIKPENVLLADGHAIVADFGIARAIAAADTPRAGRPTPAGVVVGTPDYMSPEAVVGDRVGAPGDLFAVGCMLVEMLSGRLPAPGASAHALVRGHALPAGELARLAADCIAIDPAKRPRTAGELIRRLERLAANADAPRRRARRAAVGVAAAAAVVAATLLASRARPSLLATANTPLDTMRYVVVPAEAAADRAADALRQALGQWSGITIVDAAELREALRRAPGGARASTLAPMTELARRLDAGRLVRVHATRIGDSLSVHHALYDAVTRRPLGEWTVRLPGDARRSDSAVASIAERLLFPADSSERMARSRTRSVPARRAFARGRAAADAWRLEQADSAFRSATELDPADARAWLQLATVRHWRRAPVAAWRFAAERAAGDSARLDDAERLAARALAALARGDRVAACARWSAMTRLAPDAFEGWFSLGHCLRYDSLVVRDRASPSGWRFRSSHQAALDAYERAFRIFPRVGTEVSESWFREVQALIAPSRAQQRVGISDTPERVVFLAGPYWRSDTLAYVPVPRDSVYADRGARATADDETALRQRRQFHELARMWRAQLPRSSAALEAVANALDLLGSPSAVDTMVAARRAATDEHSRLRLASLEVWMRVRQSAPRDPRGVRAAYALADSLLTRREPLDAAAAGTLAGLAALTGRASAAARYARVAEAGNVPVGIETSAPALVAFAALGGPVDSIRTHREAVERGLGAAMGPAERARARGEWLMRAELLAVPMDAWRGATPPTAPSSVPERQLAAWRSRSATTLDSLLVATRAFRLGQGISPADLTVDAAYYEAAMLAGVGRERRAAEWLDPVLDSLPRRAPTSIADVARAGTLVRAMALRAELAARAGDLTRAHAWAATVLALWPHADPHLRPTVDRMHRIVKR